MYACLQSAENLQEKAEKDCLCIYTSVWISQKGSVHFVFCASVCDLPPVSWSDTDSLFSKHTHICCPALHLCTHARVAFLDSLSLFRAIKTHIPTHIYLQQTRRVADGVKPPLNIMLRWALERSTTGDSVRRLKRHWDQLGSAQSKAQPNARLHIQFKRPAAGTDSWRGGVGFPEDGSMWRGCLCA